MKPLAIFEIGINHLGDKARALRMVDVLMAEGATHLTIQAQIDPSAYTRNAGGAQALKPFCLPLAEVAEIVSHARAAGACVGAVPFDPGDVEALREAGVSFFKILSSDISYAPLHRAVAQTGAPLYLSSAASTLEDIKRAVALLRADYPSADVRLIHTVFPAPTPREQINLSAIAFLKENIGIPVSYGQHSHERDALPAAIVAGAESVFVYVAEAADPRLPDGPHAILCNEVGETLEALKRTRLMMGPYDRALNEKEKPLRAALRRSIVAARAIARGETILPDMVRCKRPGTGLQPWDMEKVVGSVATRDYLPDDDIV